MTGGHIATLLSVLVWLGVTAPNLLAAPVITLLGGNPLIHECHAVFSDPGAVAEDGMDPTIDLTSRIVTRSAFNPDVIGIYKIFYTVQDYSGNTASVARTVIVRDTTPPSLNLLGPNPIHVDAPFNFVDPGATAMDPCVGAARISAGGLHSLALRSDGSVRAWGNNSYGQINVPLNATNVAAISAGHDFCVALRSDGTVIAWGDNSRGQLDVPPEAVNVVAIDAGYDFCVALRSDGKVIAWGRNHYGQTNVPASATNIVAVSAGCDHSLALRADGAIIGWGRNDYGAAVAPNGASNAVAVAAGCLYSLVLRADGSIFAWGENSSGLTNVPSSATNTVTLIAEILHAIALRNEGSIVIWGWPGLNLYGVLSVPANASNLVAVAAGSYHNMVLRSDGAVIAWGRNDSGQLNVPAGLDDSITNIQVTGTISFGTNTLTYSAVDPSGNTGVVSRIVIVTPRSLAIARQRVRLNFAPTKPLTSDSCTLVVSIRDGLAETFYPLGETISVDVGGVSLLFSLDAKGRGVQGESTCQLRYRKAFGWVLKVKVRGINAKPIWADYGLINTTTPPKIGVPVVLPVSITIDGKFFAGDRPLTYKAKFNSIGSAK